MKTPTLTFLNLRMRFWISVIGFTIVVQIQMIACPRLLSYITSQAATIIFLLDFIHLQIFLIVMSLFWSPFFITTGLQKIGADTEWVCNGVLSVMWRYPSIFQSYLSIDVAVSLKVGYVFWLSDFFPKMPPFFCCHDLLLIVNSRRFRTYDRRFCGESNAA